ncbi:hypothetical protein MHYP_G00015620 [Metynnis hypsauchen]
MYEQSDAAVRPKRTLKLTAKGIEQKLSMTLADRKSKFAHLCRIMKDIDVLMEDENNAHTVSRKLSTEFTEVYMEFCSLNETVKEYMSEEDMIKDQKTWYESRTKHLNGFVKDVGRWLKRAAEQAKEARQYDSEVSPADSASMVSLSHKLGKSPHSRAASVVSSNASSTKLKYEAERAALIAQATALKRKQEIDRELAQLQAKKEDLELQTAIDAANAKIEVLGLHESDVQEQEQGRPRVVRNLHAEAAFSDEPEKGDEDDVAFLLQRPTRHSPQPRPHYCVSRRQNAHSDVASPPRSHADSGSHVGGRLRDDIQIRDLLADHASRGCTVEAFLKANIWLSGPEFLLRPEDAWPIAPDSFNQSLVKDPEVKEAALFTVVTENAEDVVLKFIEHYSDWHRLKRAVAWMIKLKNTMKLLSQKRKEFASSDGLGKDKKNVQRRMAELTASLCVGRPSLDDIVDAESEIAPAGGSSG